MLFLLNIHSNRRHLKLFFSDELPTENMKDPFDSLRPTPIKL